MQVGKISAPFSEKVRECHFLSKSLAEYQDEQNTLARHPPVGSLILAPCSKDIRSQRCSFRLFER